jgi:hypothetical protein
MSLVLYLATTAVILALWSRFVQPVGRVAAIVLVLLPMTFTGRALITGRVYAPVDLAFAYEPLHSRVPDVTPHDIALSDLYCQIIPWQKAVRSALAQREWPLWNPYILCGDVLAAAAQPAVYDPFNLLALLIPLPHALTFGATLTFFLAAWSAWAFARACGRSELAAFIAATIFMAGGMLTFFVGWPLGRTWALLPLVFFGVRRVVRERKAGVLLAALVVVIVAGHPESVLHVVACGVAYGIFELCVTRNIRAIAPAALAGLVALLLTAVYLLPFIEASSQTLEHEIRTQLYAPTPYAQLAPPETRAHRIGRTFLPAFDGQPWRGTTLPQWDPLSARAGSVAFALALAALLVAWKRAETWFFFAMAVVSLGLTFGSWPFAHALHAVPLFDIAINERFAFAAVFAVAVLAAIAVDALSIRAAAAVLVAGAALTIAMLMTNARALMLAELVPLAILALLVLARWRWTPVAILALVLAQRMIVDGGIYPTLPAAMFYPPVGAIPADGRIVGVGHTLIPNSGAMYGLEDARGYEAMTFKRLTDTYPLWSTFQRAWFNIVDDPSRPFLSFLNVRTILDGTRVTTNEHALPRAFVPPRIRYERDGKIVIEQMKLATDFSQIAWIEAPSYEPQDAPNGPGRVTWKRPGGAYHSSLDLDAEMQGAGWIVVSETAWKGWRAYIDGHRVETHFANHAFVGVHVAAGRHRVRLVYLPESFTRGRNITFATLLALALYAALRHRLQQPRAV